MNICWKLSVDYLRLLSSTEKRRRKALLAETMTKRQRPSPQGVKCWIRVSENSFHGRMQNLMCKLRAVGRTITMVLPPSFSTPGETEFARALTPVWIAREIAVKHLKVNLPENGVRIRFEFRILKTRKTFLIISLRGLQRFEYIFLQMLLRGKSFFQQFQTPH